MTGSLRFKLADEPAEFEAIHRLNYRTFVEEIPQHPRNDAGRLVDRFHAENTYAICLHGDELVGMIAGRCARPFSLDHKLPDLDRYLPPHRKVVEIRLLAVDRRYRKQAVFAKMAGVLANHFRPQGCDLAVISGTVRELRLYRHLGFRPFGPLVGDAQARYQPMFLTLESYAARAAHLEVVGGRTVTNLMPGPVAIADAVKAAFSAPPMSHRSPGFVALMSRVRGRLRELCGVKDALVMLGSGTLANDAIGAQLATSGRTGLVLANGEFGERLTDHARRWRLEFRVVRADWGQTFRDEQLRAAFAQARPGWVWMVACESSTGVRNDLALVSELCREDRADLCVDAVSAVGLAATDLSAARFASTASGKALGSYPGLAIVCHDGSLAPRGSVPRYLDLSAYQDARGVPYTHSSNLVAALDAALAIDWPRRWKAVREADQRLRDGLRRNGIAIVAPNSIAMPGVVSVALPPEVPAAVLARRMARSGYLLAHRSDYLARRNWLQICLMGAWDDPALEIFPEVLARHARVCSERASAQSQTPAGGAAIEPIARIGSAAAGS
jgi:aspartate aminotransferase-like enzyme/GNAT superfamily N-acetyltransferase